MSAAETEPAPLPAIVSFRLASSEDGTAACAPASAPIWTYLIPALS